MKKSQPTIKYPGVRAALDGNSAVIHCERESTDAAGAFPITPSTQMGEQWAEETANGHINISNRPLIFIEPEGEHAAAAVTAGLSMTGLRAANFSSGQGIAYMHESLYAAVGKRLTYVLNIGARAMTKSTLNVHAGHDDYHCIDDTGFFQMFAKNAQHAADLNIIAHRIAELALNPGIVAQDGFLTTHMMESLLAPERELIAEYLGRPDDIIPTPTPAQRILFGDTRRRIPLLWDVDNALQSGTVQNQDSYMQSVAAQRPFFFAHIAQLTDLAFMEFAQLTGREYARVQSYRTDDADYVIVGQGSVVANAEAVADYLRDTRGVKVGVVNLLMYRPFPGDLVGALLQGKKGVAVLERTDQPLASDLPLMREVRATLAKCVENGRTPKQPPYADHAVYRDADDLPALYSGVFGLGSRDLQPEGLVATIENMLPGAAHRRLYYLGIDFLRDAPLTPKQDVYQQTLARAYPHVRELALRGSENPNLMPRDSITVRLHSVGGWGAIATGKNLALTLFDLLGYHIKANPRYGAEKKGQPTTYYLSAAPEPIRINSEYYYVDVVLSPDPNVLQHTNALAGLKEHGVFIIQSDLDTPEKVWASVPPAYRKIIVDKHLRMFYLDAFRIAREEATDPDLQLRMQGIAFQGAFFAASNVMQNAGLDEARLLEAVKAQLQRKFGAKGARVVEDNLRVVQRGFDEIKEIIDKPVAAPLLPPLPAAPFLHPLPLGGEGRGEGVTSEKSEGSAGQPLTPAISPLHGERGKELREAAAPFLHPLPASRGEGWGEGGMKTTAVGEPRIPVMLRRLPQSHAALSDVQRFWEQTGNFYARGLGNDNLADPFIATGTIPASSAVFRDMTGIRFEHPHFIAENCTACGNCYTVCPDTAIPGLVNTTTQIFDTLLARLRKHGHKVTLLPKAVRVAEQKLRGLMHAAQEHDSFATLLNSAIEQTLAAGDAAQRDALAREFDTLRAELGTMQFALTRPYYTLPEKKAPGSGALFSVTVNPYTCKGCGECIAVCEDDALRATPQTAESVQHLRDAWDLWLDLPNTPPRYIRVDDLEQRIGALQTILLDKNVYGSFTSGDGACMGCSEKTVIHLFIATVEALMQPRVRKHVEELASLIERLERHIQLKLAQEINVDDVDAMQNIIAQLGSRDVTLSDIAARIEALRGKQPIDPAWLQRVVRLVAELKQLHQHYNGGVTGRGRTSMGILNSTGCTSVWGSTYPYNPYPFPWANHLFQDAPSLAMGVFEGHMAKMAQGFKAVRMAELELAGQYNSAEHDRFFTYFDWRQFSDAEFALCPPVAVIGGDGAMYDIGFQNLSRMMMSGRPIKVVVVDTQVYSNTGGQACTSGFLGQLSDMAPFGTVVPGKQETRKEIGLIGMAHRTTYVMQSTIAHANHMIEGFIEGLLSRRPALFNCYATCQPEHGVADNAGDHQAKLAVESRAYPLFRYNPDKGKTPAECFDLDGNPALEKPWPSYALKYHDGETEKEIELPLTFADFAATETRFRKHFRTAPPDTWHDEMVPLAEFLELAVDARAGKYPYIWTLDRKRHLSRLLVDATMVASCEDRRDFWTMLKAIAGAGRAAPSTELEAKLRHEIVQQLVADLEHALPGEHVATVREAAAPPAAAAGEVLAPWIDTEQCTACGECITINPNIFAYNAQKKAYLKNANGGPYRDLVKAAERCTAQIIHPGLPRDRSAKDIEMWIKRAEKFNR